jgi:hypothetical protein
VAPVREPKPLLRSEHPGGLLRVPDYGYDDLLIGLRRLLDDSEVSQVDGIERPGVEGHGHTRQCRT